MALAADSIGMSRGWLRDRGFDLHFIVGIAALALVSGFVVVWNPAFFLPVLVADLWLLGYHHVIATYTRLCFDRESFQAHRFLVLWLPLLVLGCVLALGYGAGLWVLVSIYLYWQWFHYAQQSWRVAQAYRRKSGGLADDGEWLTRLTFWIVPVWGILNRSSQDPGMFLGLELRVLPIPELAADFVEVATLFVLAGWLAARALDWWRGRLAIAHSLYMATHFLIFGVAYVLIEDITYGWLVINIWHNAQYLVLVWLHNSTRFRDGIDPKAEFLSWISQPHKSWLYFGVCIGLSTFAYAALANTAALLVPALVVYQTFCFHHFIADALIWTDREEPFFDRRAAEPTIEVSRRDAPPAIAAGGSRGFRTRG